MSAHPGSNLKKEMEQGSPSELDYFLLQVPIAGCLDSVSVTLFRTAVKRANCRVAKLLCTGRVTGGVPTSTVTVLVTVVGLIGLWASISSVFRGWSSGISYS